MTMPEPLPPWCDACRELLGRLVRMGEHGCPHRTDRLVYPDPLPTDELTDGDRVRYAQQVLHAAYTLGGHWILCGDNKRAWRQGWQKIPADLDELYEHVASGAGLPGLIPASVGFSVLDIDKGPADRRHAVRWLAPPAYATASGTPGNEHLWYRDTEWRNNRRWEARPTAGGTLSREESEPHTVGGEVRSGHGYVVFWPDAAQAFNEGRVNPGDVTFAEACEILWLDAPAPEAVAQAPVTHGANWTRGNAPLPAADGWQRGYAEATRLVEALHGASHGYQPGDYEDWIATGMAMHEAAARGQIDPGQAFEEWVKWSATSAKFKSDADCWAHWRSFGNPSTRPITPASLFRR